MILRRHNSSAILILALLAGVASAQAGKPPSVSMAPVGLVTAARAAQTMVNLNFRVASGFHINSNTAAPLLRESLSGLGLFGLMLTGAGKKRGKGKMTILLGAMLLVMMFTLVGCGGTSTGGSTGTPAGSYTVGVTSTGTGTGAPTHTLNVTLVVTP